MHIHTIGIEICVLQSGGSRSSSDQNSVQNYKVMKLSALSLFWSPLGAEQDKRNSNTTAGSFVFPFPLSLYI